MSAADATGFLVAMRPASKRRQGQRQRRFAILLLLLQLTQTETFALLPTAPRRLLLQDASQTVLRATRAKKAGGPTFGGKTKKTKLNDKRLLDRNQPSNSSNKKKKNESSPKTSAAKSSSPASKSPPWQVLSPRAAQQNVEQEQKRRALARQGIVMEPETQSSQQRILSKALLTDVERRLLSWKRFNPSTLSSASLTFVGAYLEQQLPPRLGVPEIAFLGRSNVGKSSLLNRLCSQCGASSSSKGGGARVGKTPGATASVNLYSLAKSPGRGSPAGRAVLGLVDLPGFGYAKLGRAAQEAVREAAEGYLSGRQRELALGILLVDARRSPSDDDRAVLAALYDLGLPVAVVATKLDKLGAGEVGPAMRAIRERLGLPGGQPLCVSSVTGQGIKELWKIIMEACESKVEELADELQRSGGGTTASGDATSLQEAAITIQLDDEGNPLPPDDDGEELGYAQGYDWIQDSAVMYEHGQSYETLEVDDDDNEFYDDDDDFDSSQEFMSENTLLPTFKELKKRVRKMEKRGEI